MTRAAIGTRTGLVERAFDPDRDFPAMVELIWAVNRFDEVPYFPTVEGLQVDWALTPTFDPSRDHRLIFDDDLLVAAGGHQWRERDGKVIHSIELWVRPESRRRGLGTRLLAWAEARAREARAEGRGGPPALPHHLSMGTSTSIAAGASSARYLLRGMKPKNSIYEQHFERAGESCAAACDGWRRRGPAAGGHQDWAYAGGLDV